MTLEEACRLLDPNTTAEELAKIEYYNGFNGKKACIAAIDEACTLLVGAVRSAHQQGAERNCPGQPQSLPCTRIRDQGNF